MFLRITLGIIGSIAVMHAIFASGLIKRRFMTNEQFEREMRYRTVMAVARSMLNRRLISKEEYDAFDSKMIDKYNPLFGGLKGTG